MNTSITTSQMPSMIAPKIQSEIVQVYEISKEDRELMFEALAEDFATTQTQD